MADERAGDETEVLEALTTLAADRVRRLGAETYGPLELNKDPRSMVREALLEVVDSLFYVGAELVKLDRSELIHALPREVALAVSAFPGASFTWDGRQHLTAEPGPAGVLALLEFIAKGIGAPAYEVHK